MTRNFRLNTFVEVSLKAHWTSWKCKKKKKKKPPELLQNKYREPPASKKHRLLITFEAVCLKWNTNNTTLSCLFLNYTIKGSFHTKTEFNWGPAFMYFTPILNSVFSHKQCFSSVKWQFILKCFIHPTSWADRKLSTSRPSQRNTRRPYYLYLHVTVNSSFIIIGQFRTWI